MPVYLTPAASSGVTEDRPDPEPGVVTPGPHKQRKPGGTSEPNPKAAPYLLRGKYPQVGETYRIANRDPVVAQGLNKLGLAIAGQPINWEPPLNATSFELEFGDWVRTQLEDLTVFPAGWPNLMFNVSVVSERDGFAWAEKVFGEDAQTGWWGYKRLKWLEPWQCVEWVTDRAGWPKSAWIDGDGPADPDSPTRWVRVVREKLAVFTRWSNGLNPEGVAGLRALRWWSELKRQRMIQHSIALERFGPGTPVIFWGPQASNQDKEAAKATMDRFVRGEQRHMGFPDSITLEMFHGASAPTNVEQDLRAIDGQLSRGVDDMLGQVGTAQYGSNALSQTILEASNQGQRGLFAILLGHARHELVRPLYLNNRAILERYGSSVSRQVVPRPVGLDDLTQLRTLAEFAREDIFTKEEKRLVALKILEAFGIRAQSTLEQPQPQQSTIRVASPLRIGDAP